MSRIAKSLLNINTSLCIVCCYLKVWANILEKGTQSSFIEDLIKVFSLFLLGFCPESKLNSFRILQEALHKEACKNLKEFQGCEWKLKLKVPANSRSLKILGQNYFHPSCFKISSSLSPAQLSGIVIIIVTIIIIIIIIVII